MVFLVLEEMRIRGLGVISDAVLELSPGFTVVTGETGAGKTMLVEALELLVGGKVDTALVRPGTDEATIEGRFVLDDEEVVLSRVVPAVGRSRAYVNGRIAPASSLAEWGTRLVDLHGQHEHQSLLSPAVQRHALDQFGSVELTTFLDAKRDLAAAPDAASKRAELVGEYTQRFANPYVAAERGYIDDVIEPKETRWALIRGLELCLKKTVERPQRKHGNIPL